MKTALITGSSDPHGIGFTAAHLLAAQHGFNVVLSGRKKTSVEAAVAALSGRLSGPAPSSAAKPLVYGVELDVCDTASILSALAQLQAPDGPLAASNGALDVLINNAAVGAPAGRGGKGTKTMFLQTELTTADDMNNVLATNVSAVVQVTNTMLPLLAKAPAPRIVNVSSARGSLAFESGLPSERTGALVYNVSKTALNMVTLMQAKNLPQHAKPNLKVNAACPGHVKTPFNNFTGLRTLEEGAAVYVHLATLPDDGPTGQAIGDHAPFSTAGKFVQIPW